MVNYLITQGWKVNTPPGMKFRADFLQNQGWHSTHTLRKWWRRGECWVFVYTLPFVEIKQLKNTTFVRGGGLSYDPWVICTVCGSSLSTKSMVFVHRGVDPTYFSRAVFRVRSYGTPTYYKQDDQKRRSS